MRQATLPLSEVGLIAATRGIAGAGAGLLIAGRIPAKQRKMVGWGLFAVGALSTIPLIVDVARKCFKADSAANKGESLAPQKPERTHPRATRNRRQASMRG